LPGTAVSGGEYWSVQRRHYCRYCGWLASTCRPTQLILFVHLLDAISKSLTAPFNHNQTGLVTGQRVNSAARNSLVALPGYAAKGRLIVLGRGRRVFDKATKLLHSFSFLKALDWVDISANYLQQGDTFATQTRFYCLPIWSFNPCRCVSSVAGTSLSSSDSVGDGKSGQTSEVVFSTLQGHVIAGQEAFRVHMEGERGSYVPESVPRPTGSLLTRNINSVLAVPGIPDEGGGVVVFEVVSCSRGSGVLGGLLMPLLRPLQDKFMRDCCESMFNLVNYK
jgi:uncharacterized protein (UPF0548 family)